MAAAAAWPVPGAGGSPGRPGPQCINIAGGRKPGSRRRIGILPARAAAAASDSGMPNRSLISYAQGARIRFCCRRDGRCCLSHCYRGCGRNRDHWAGRWRPRPRPGRPPGPSAWTPGPDSESAMCILLVFLFLYFAPCLSLGNTQDPCESKIVKEKANTVCRRQSTKVMSQNFKVSNVHAQFDFSYLRGCF